LSEEGQETAAVLPKLGEREKGGGRAGGGGAGAGAALGTDKQGRVKGEKSQLKKCGGKRVACGRQDRNNSSRAQVLLLLLRPCPALLYTYSNHPDTLSKPPFLPFFPHLALISPSTCALRTPTRPQAALQAMGCCSEGLKGQSRSATGALARTVAPRRFGGRRLRRSRRLKVRRLFNGEQNAGGEPVKHYRSGGSGVLDRSLRRFSFTSSFFFLCRTLLALVLSFIVDAYSPFLPNPTHVHSELADVPPVQLDRLSPFPFPQPLLRNGRFTLHSLRP
jgi:hypothetical protein